METSNASASFIRRDVDETAHEDMRLHVAARSEFGMVDPWGAIADSGKCADER
jgi:hypothetical protein